MRKGDSYVKGNAGSMGLLQQGTKSNTGAVVSVRGGTQGKGKNSQVRQRGTDNLRNAQSVRKGRQAKKTSSLAGFSIWSMRYPFSWFTHNDKKGVYRIKL